MGKTTAPKPDFEPRRLVKAWLPPDVVADMDSLIRTSRAYSGRDDFILEALSDRIAEEKQGRPAPSTRPTVVTPADGGSATATGSTPLGLWQSQSAITVPATKGHGPLIGLHNRDFPTLWAADLLASLTTARGEAVSWMHFVPRVASTAWEFADELATIDEARGLDSMKAATGFPKNSTKRLAAEQRFTEHMLGSIRQAKPQGPLFALALAGVVDEGGDRVAPTKVGLALLKALGAAGMSPRPPHSEGCWRLFRDHIKTSFKVEYETWMRVIARVATQPSPTQLAQAFEDEWPGSAAQTNVSGYISRGREWGLIDPKLADGKYRLTEAGVQELKEGSLI